MLQEHELVQDILIPVDTGIKNWRKVHTATHLVSGSLWSSVYGGEW